MINWIDLTEFIDLLKVVRVREWELQMEMWRENWLMKFPLETRTFNGTSVTKRKHFSHKLE